MCMNRLLLRKEAAWLLNISPGTLAVWDCRGGYDLRPLRMGGRIYYRKFDLIRYFLQWDDMAVLDERLLTRKEAATYLDKSPGTLAVWSCNNRYDLRPLKIGNCVRYSRIYLKHFLNQQMKERTVSRTSARFFPGQHSGISKGGMNEY